jgi:TPR repeat protein
MWSFRDFDKAIQNHEASAILVYNVIASILDTMPPICKDNVSWYKDQAHAGDHKAQFILAILHHMGEEVDADLEKAYKLYLKASQGGLAQAKFLLGLLHQSKRNPYLDPEKAAKCFFEAAELGLAAGQLYAAFEYECGHSVEKDISKAIDLYKKAVEQDLTIAECLLGMHYYLGEKIEKNNSEAFKLFSRSAKKHHHTSEYFLGLMYYKGDALFNEGAEGIFTFVSPLENLNTEAHHRLGPGLAQRRQMHFNLLEAFRLFQSAAEKGNKKAMMKLSEMYLLGEGVPKNEIMAETWRRRAVKLKS